MSPSGAPIERLLGGCRPAAVSGLVISVVIDAVKPHARRRLAHVGEEVLEGEPPFADRNAAGAVIREPSVIRIAASLDHRRPASVGRGLRASGRMAVFQVPGDELIPVKAPAACGASSQIGTVDADFSSAVADAAPSRTALIAGDDKATKAVAGDIFESRHAVLPQRRRCLETARRFHGGPSCCFGISWGALQ